MTQAPKSTSPLDIRIVGRTDAAITGLSRYARSLYQYLSRRDQRVSIVGTKPIPLPRVVYSGAARVGFDLETFFRSYPLLLPHMPPDAVIHLMSQGQASAIAFGRKPHVVITVHDLITAMYRRNPELTGYMRFYDKGFDDVSLRGLMRADRLIAVSECTRQAVIQHLGYPAERITTIYEGVDHDIFSPKPIPAEFYARYGLHVDVPYILYLGSEDPRKNLNRLLDAFGQVLAHYPEARLLKVGGGRFRQERQNLLEKIATSGMIDKVTIIDQVSDAELTYFYNVATVFAFPSLYEGFGLPALEALACGTPVVATQVSSLPEVVADAALLVDPYDVAAIATAIERILNDSLLRATLRERSLQRAALFTWERTVDQTLDVYARLCQSGV